LLFQNNWENNFQIPSVLMENKDIDHFFDEIPIYKTKIVKNDDYKENYKKMTNLIDDLNKKLEKSLYQGEKKHLDKHIKGGGILARDRVEFLLDEDSPFLEIGSLAGYDQKGLL
jgi:hypothetical protein